MTTRRTFLQLGAAVGAGALSRWQLDPTSGLLFNTVRAFASVGTPQTALDGGTVPEFVDPLPTFAGRRIGDASIEVGMFEFQQNVLPENLYAGRPAPFSTGTYVWGYQVGDAAPSWPGATIEAQRGRTTTVKYVNALPLDPFLRKYLTFDQTIHWADPLHQMGSFDPFTGPIPTVVHLHGAEDSSLFDGAPEAWFTPDGRHGKGYSTLIATDPNAAVYEYPNGQQAATLWFHDHALGITRLNVFSGLAAFYFIRDQYDTGRSDNPLRLPAGPQEIELMIQDRQFDTNGQLLFPDSPANPSLVDGPPGNPGLHPYWIPEFFGDVICVNGRSWPHLNVEPRRYRFRIVNASNARFFRMGLADSASGAQGPSLWQIGTDGGLLDRPVKLPGLVEPPATDPSPTTRLFLAPSERADIILDFTGLSGRRFTLTNDAQVPFPSGSPLDPSDPTRAVMEFRVTLPLSGSDTTYNPASGAPLRGGPNQQPIIVRLADPSAGRGRSKHARADLHGGLGLPVPRREVLRVQGQPERQRQVGAGELPARDDHPRLRAAARLPDAKRRWGPGRQPGLQPVPVGTGPAAAARRSGLEGYHQGVPGLREPHRRPLGATGRRRQRCPAGPEPLFVRPHERARLRAALPHSRPRGQRNDAPLPAGALTGVCRCRHTWNSRPAPDRRRGTRHSTLSPSGSRARSGPPARRGACGRSPGSPPRGR